MRVCAENLDACRSLLHAELHKPAGASEPQVTAVGHAHIDTAWLWPVAETVRKCARTFATQLALIDAYPGYVFGASQAQHYAFVKETYPALYKRLKGAVAAGRWEVQGGMWVEADCNLAVRRVAGAPAPARQELLPRRVRRRSATTSGCPTSSATPRALPQILRKAGIQYFLTQKISWNQFNKFPHTTFRWRGIDGTEVIAHFPPENTYSSLLDAETMIAGAENFREKDRSDASSCRCSAWATAAAARRTRTSSSACAMADLEGTPRVRFGTAQRVLRAGSRSSADQLPSGSASSTSSCTAAPSRRTRRSRRRNRMLENRLRAVEFLWSCLPLDAYPAGTLDAIWKNVLLNQFHDILPGSSIARPMRSRTGAPGSLEACDGLL